MDDHIPSVNSDSLHTNIQGLAAQELEHIKRLGSDDILRFLSSNLGAYEAVLYIISKNIGGVPIYEMATNVRCRFASQSGILSRIKTMREMGLLEDRAGTKKSQVLLAPSEDLLVALGQVLSARNEPL